MSTPPPFNDAGDLPFDKLDEGFEVALGLAEPFDPLRLLDRSVDHQSASLQARDASSGSSNIALICAADVETEQVTWLWPGRIPRGKLTILEGDPGLGKSTLLYDLAARLSMAASMPDGARIDRVGSTVILSAEDGVADTIVPRLRAAGADMGRVHVLEGLDLPDGTRRPLAIPNDVELLREAIERTGAELVIVDPLTAFLGPEINAYRDQDVRRALHPLKDLAEELGTAIILCRHLTKSVGGSAIYRGGGSIGIIGAARCCMIMAKDPDMPDSGRVILAVSKSNLGALPRSLAFHVGTDDSLGCSRISWEPGEVLHTARDLCAPTIDGEEGYAIEEAMDFLREELSEGSRTAKEIDKSARDAAIAPATLRRAKKKMGVISERQVSEFGDKTPWMWTLPTVDPPIDAHIGAHTRGDEHLSVAMSTYANSSKNEDPAAGALNDKNGDSSKICLGAQAPPLDAHASGYEHLSDEEWEEGEI